ncbi:MAG TPA: thiamine pyrophosphate-binding protein [Polyangiaceae bacterium]|jgi:acetolactate synthase-1/2/3 large subunit
MPQETIKSCTVAELLVRYLAAEGVTRVFGIPGGASIWVMLELRKQKIDFIVCRHETAAAYMADGHARVTGGLGVVLTTSGPGATNAVTGAMNAEASNISLLVITGEVPEKFFGEGYLQEGIDAKLNVDGVYANAVDSSALIASSTSFQTLIQQALRDARSLPNGAAHISLPNDVASTCIPTPNKPNPASYQVVSRCADVQGIEETLRDLVEAERPLFFLGNGSRAALADDRRREEFTRFVDRFGIPVMTTPDAKGIFPESHEMSLRNYGMCQSAWPALYMQSLKGHYDALVVLGSAMGQLATMVNAAKPYDPILIPQGSFTQVDIDARVIARDFPVTRGMVGEVGASLDVLLERARHARPHEEKVRARKAVIAQIKESLPAWADPKGRESNAAPVHPAAMMRVITELMKDGEIFIDAGNCVGWSLNDLVVDPPTRYRSALDMGPMGFASGAVVGGKLGKPNKPCIAIIGDGAFMMHGAEISTAAQNGVGAVWIVLDDNDLAMVSQGMDQLFPKQAPWEPSYALGAPDLAKFAEGLGANAVTIARDQNPEHFRAALKSAIERADADRRPQAIIVKIDTKPMPPYGWPQMSIPDCANPSKT